MIAIATIIVFDFMTSTNTYQRRMRAFVEDVQGIASIRSAANLGLLILSAPKPPETKDVDWLSDPWAAVASAPSIPLEGISGDLRMAIVDEDGKIDLSNLTDQNPGAQQSADSGAGYWRNVLSELFKIVGINPRSYERESFITLGDTALEPKTQISTIVDWIDRDKEPFHDTVLSADGLESQANAAWFFNRPLKNIWELTYVPGMTYERVRKLSSFIRISGNPGGGSRVNVNTAPFQVLVALGLPESQAENIMEKRLQFPYNTAVLNQEIAGYQQLSGKLKTNSGEFSALIRVKLPVRTVWGRVLIKAQPPSGTGQRKTSIKSLEIF